MDTSKKQPDKEIEVDLQSLSQDWLSSMRDDRRKRKRNAIYDKHRRRHNHAKRLERE